MKIKKNTFGIMSDGKKVHLYTLKAGELSLSLSTRGATWMSLIVPSRSMGKDDVILGANSFDGSLSGRFAAATIGRFANRIAGGKFSIDGKEYQLFSRTPGAPSLHGGRIGYSRKIWKAEAYEERDGVFVRFELKSPDGDEGYPGNLRAAVSYGLTKSNELVVDYEAKVDAPSPVNFTNHVYFNLAGEGRGLDVLAQELKMNCSSYVEVDENLIPTGKLLPTKGTPFDFEARKPIGRDIKELTATNGYDHCLVVDGEPGELRPFAEAYDPHTGRTMRCFTTQPGVQLFTMNSDFTAPGKTGMYRTHSAFCLETQHFPDAPNHPHFPSSIFGPDRDYHERAVFAFDW
ncbi:MAG: galactose mutarotase [Treponema sp.]|nr:galactose mutarotase [Treponema sp.]